MSTFPKETKKAEASPMVSVVLPAHNRESTLARAIRSVLNQTFADFELIVVDDASKDNSRKVVESFPDPRLRYIRHETNKGACAARNTGIDAAGGELIAFQDSDDEWLPEKLGRQVELLRTRGMEYGACYTNFIRIQDNRPVPIRWGEVAKLDGNILHSLLHISFVSTQTLMVRAELLSRTGHFDECLPRHQDWDLALRIARITRFAFIPEPMAIVYNTPGNISSDSRADIVGRSRILEKVAKFSEADPVHLRNCVAKHNYILGRAAARLHDGKMARQFLLKAILLKPWMPKYWVAMALTAFA